MSKFFCIFATSLKKALLVIVGTVLLMMVAAQVVDNTQDHALPWIMLLIIVKNWYKLALLWLGVSLVGSLVEYWRTDDEG